jgi:hypothetical protein
MRLESAANPLRACLRARTRKLRARIWAHPQRLILKDSSSKTHPQRLILKDSSSKTHPQRLQAFALRRSSSFFAAARRQATRPLAARSRNRRVLLDSSGAASNDPSNDGGIARCGAFGNHAMYCQSQTDEASALYKAPIRGLAPRALKKLSRIAESWSTSGRITANFSGERRPPAILGRHLRTCKYPRARGCTRTLRSAIRYAPH